MHVERPTYKLMPDGIGKSKAVDEDGGLLARLWNTGAGSWRIALSPEFISDKLYPTYVAAEAEVRRVIESWD